MGDLIERLRSLADCDARSGEPLGKCMREAAATIERLTAAIAASQARVAEMEAALRRLLACPYISDSEANDPEWGCPETAAAERYARAALDAQPAEGSDAEAAALRAGEQDGEKRDADV